VLSVLPLPRAAFDNLRPFVDRCLELFRVGELPLLTDGEVIIRHSTATACHHLSPLAAALPADPGSPCCASAPDPAGFRIIPSPPAECEEQPVQGRLGMLKLKSP
jgi:hypothetical protein